MELPSRRRRRRRSRARHHLIHLGPRGGGADRLSALTDDLLLEVLARVGCARTAARFGILSRRWRGLWAGLPEVVLHDVPLHSLEPALALFNRPTLSRLDIRVDKRHSPNASRVTSLLRAAQRLSPEGLVFNIPSVFYAPYKSIDLPVFHGATSIRLDSGLLRVRPPPAGEGDFSALQTLSLSVCIVQDLHAMVSRCPRLRVLRYRTHSGECSDDLRIKVHSATLEELVVESGSKVKHSIDIVTPVLKQLSSSFRAIPALSMSILAPMVEKCTFAYRPQNRNWGLTRLSLSIVICNNVHAPSSLDIHACFESDGFEAANHSFGQEIDKHLVADISLLNIHLTIGEHVFGAFVLHFLERDRIRSAIQRLKVHLLRSEDEGEGHKYCRCHDDQIRMRTQIVTLTNLQEVEIDGIEGVDHELDFLRLVFRCAPMLTRMNVRLSEMFTPNDDACKKIYNISKAHPSVECYVYLGTNKQVLHE